LAPLPVLREPANTAMEQAGQLTDFGSKPLVVLTAGEGSAPDWFAKQDCLAALSTNSAHHTAGVRSGRLTGFIELGANCGPGPGRYPVGVHADTVELFPAAAGFVAVSETGVS
jgi:hypothetical protein